jgi:class 3 adenylate cyclase
MVDGPIALSPAHPARMRLEPYLAEIRFSTLTLGTDNLHYDVYLSPRFVEQTSQYLHALLRQAANINMFYGVGTKPQGPPETGAFRKTLTELLQGALTQAKFQQNIEIDLLMRLGLLKFLIQEIGNEFSNFMVECKDWIRGRGDVFEHSEQAHVIRSRVAEIQADRKNIFRQVGQTLYQLLKDVEESALSKSRRALFGDDFAETYDMFKNRLLFVEGGNDDFLSLEHYVLVGKFSQDIDRFENFDDLLLDFLQEFVLPDSGAEELNRAKKAHDRLVEQARALRAELSLLEEEQEDRVRKTDGADELFGWFWKSRSAAPAQEPRSRDELEKRRHSLEEKLAEMAPQLEALKHRTAFLAAEFQGRLGDYINEPENARRLFDAKSSAPEGNEIRERLLEEWVGRLEERDMLVHVLASYELRNLYLDYCPPVHLQQLKKALVFREEAKRVELILQQFPARDFSMKRIEETGRNLRRYPRDEVKAVVLRFVDDLMRLRRDRRNYQHVTAWTDRIQLVRSERSRELSRANRSLHEFLLPDEARPVDDPVVSHAVIKADVRGSTRITKELLARGLNPASHFSLNLHEPVKRLLERHSAAKVFIEGDAIILAIYETESTRANQRAVAKACVLAREILAVTDGFNARAAKELPRLEIGVGVAFQGSAPAIWMDGDSRIMISRALNLSDRLSSCSKLARRLLADNRSPFNVFLLQPMMEGSASEEIDELIVRYNLNGIELSDDGFAKLTNEISLAPMGGSFTMPWGKDHVETFYGEVPFGDVLEPLVIRKGVARELLPDGKIGGPGTKVYYEVCTHPKLLALARKKVSASSPKSQIPS